MDVVERAASVVTGIEVVAPFGDLAVLVPRAWAELFAQVGDGPCAEASRSLGDGRYREVVGVLGAPGAGPARAVLPAGRYVRHVHDGPVAGIGEAFGAMHAWAEERGLRVGDLKLDVGYTRAGDDGPHELLVDLRG